MGMCAQGEVGRSERLNLPGDSWISAEAWTKKTRPRRVGSDNTVSTECLGCETRPSGPLRELSLESAEGHPQ